MRLVTIRYCMEQPPPYLSFSALLATLGGILLIWIGAYGGFSLIIPAMGIELSYSETPLEVAAYYLAWVGIAALAFPRTIARVHTAQSARAYGALVLVLSAIALFYAIGIEMLPGHGTQVYANDFFLFADSNFFIPKFAELLLQQVLIVATVLTLASFDRNIFFVSLMYGIMFGFAHVFILVEIPPAYVAFLAGAAVISAAVFPYLILRVKNGFIYSFILHWLFYVALTVLHLSGI